MSVAGAWCASLFAVLSACAALLSGCQSDTAALAPSAFPMLPAGAKSRSLRASEETICSSAPYQEAVRRYARGDYRGALAALDTLDSSALSRADCAFLERQRLYCQNALPPGTQAAGKKVPATSQARNRTSATSTDSANCGPRALLLVCQKMGMPADLEKLRRAAGTTRSGTTLDGLSKAASSVGLAAQGVQMDRDALSHLSTPAIAWNNGNHYIAVLGVHQRLWDGATVATIHDPNHQNEEEISQADLLSKSGGILLTLKRH